MNNHITRLEFALLALSLSVGTGVLARLCHAPRWFAFLLAAVVAVIFCAVVDAANSTVREGDKT